MGFYKDYLYNDAITWTTDGANAGTVQYRTGKFYCTNVCGVLLSNKVKANQMIAEALNNVAKNYVSYVGNPKLMNNVMADIEIILSKNQNERESISKLFYTLDNIITLHQRKYFCSNNLIFTITTAWEQRKLGDLCSEIGDGLHSAPIYDEKGSYFFINGNNLVNGKIIIDENETKKVSQNIFNDNNKNLDNTTLLLSINGTIGNLAYYQGEQVMLGKSAAYLKCKFVDKTYLYGVLQTNLILKSFMASLTGTTIKNLGLEVIKNTYIFSPKVNEQVKIGKYFHNLDNLITLHQRECFFIKKEVQNVKFN